MEFVPFNDRDFRSMTQVGEGGIPDDLLEKVNSLRLTLGALPEFRTREFQRIVRRGLRPVDGVIFRRPVADEEHWFTYNRGGDQDEVQLNIGMWRDHIRVGLAFMIGRQDIPKIPAFHVFQVMIGSRPPLPFRDALLQCIERNGFRIEGYPDVHDPREIMALLETYPVARGSEKAFVFLGALWIAKEAAKKTIEDYRRVFDELLPFYQTLFLVCGRLDWNEYVAPASPE